MAHTAATIPTGPKLHDPLGDCLQVLADRSPGIMAALDQAFPEPTDGLAWSSGGIAATSAGTPMAASAHWRRHMDRAAELQANLTKGLEHRAEVERRAIAYNTRWGQAARWCASEAASGRGIASLVLLGSKSQGEIDGPVADTGCNGVLHALADRLWRLRAWLMALKLAALVDNADSTLADPISGTIARLLAEGTTWATMTASAFGQCHVLEIQAPEGTSDVRGIRWPAPPGTQKVGTADPIGLAKAAGASGLAVTGLSTDVPECSFETPDRKRVYTGIVGQGVEDMREIAVLAENQNNRGTTFRSATNTGRAWSNRDNTTWALHLSIDSTEQRPRIEAPDLSSHSNPVPTAAEYAAPHQRPIADGISVPAC